MGWLAMGRDTGPPPSGRSAMEARARPSAARIRSRYWGRARESRGVTLSQSGRANGSQWEGQQACRH
eukprot:scaffold11225_cov112-Isochrysis_galbana.AAC.1